MKDQESVTSVSVREFGVVQSWSLICVRPATYKEAQKLVLRAPDGRSWSGTGHDWFKTLKTLRLQLEADSIEICCAGAKMSFVSVYGGQEAGEEGRIGYLGSPRRYRGRALMDIFASVPCEDVVSVAEQESWNHVQGMRGLRWRDRWRVATGGTRVTDWFVDTRSTMRGSELTIGVMDRGIAGSWNLLLVEGEYEAPLVVSLTADDGRQWSGEGSDWFEALLALRRVLDPEEISLCVAGARANLVVSGMQADMGRGWTGYLVRRRLPASLRRMVCIFTPAPFDKVVTVPEQEAFKMDWLASIGATPGDKASRIVRRGHRE